MHHKMSQNVGMLGQSTRRLINAEEAKRGAKEQRVSNTGGRSNIDQFLIPLTKHSHLGIGTFLSDRLLFTQKLREL